MLQPSNRLTLIDAMRPPPGMSLESAMAVTFTLDLRALLAVPAAFALTASDGLPHDESEYEPIDLLHAVRAHAGKLTVFNHVGEIALPPSRRVFAFLETSVVPVRAPRGGVVHPKIWVLRYEPAVEVAQEQADSRLRVLVASRNLTFDASWDTVIRLDESDDGTGADLQPIADLFEGLIATADATLAAGHERRVASLSGALRSAKFAVPRGVDDLHVRVMGLTPTSSPLPVEADRSLIISPFVTDDFFTSIRPAPVDEFVSRPESLDLLRDRTLADIGAAYAFDDGSAVELDATEERLSLRDPGRPLVGLHAKVFAFEDGGRARLFVGSANATARAFTSNVEVLIELEGPISTLGIDRLCEGSDDEHGLRSLFVTYSRPAAAILEPEVPALDRARRAIARLSIEGFVEASDTGWAVTYRSAEPVPAVDDATIYCWPLASPGNRRRVGTDEILDVRFETTIETISGFLAFELVDGGGGLTQFVVPVPLQGVPEDRDRLLLRALIGNAGRFLRYVLAMLDEDASQGDPTGGSQWDRSDEKGDSDRLPALPVLEKLLRAARRDPAKLEGLHPLVSDLAADDALPPGFADLWTILYGVAVDGRVSR